MVLPLNVMRDIQSRFAYLLDAKYRAQRVIRTVRKIPFEYEFKILKYLQPEDRCVIDVGANQGQTIDAVRLYHPTTQIYSFEPGQVPFDKLVTKFEGDENLKLFHMGLGKAELTADLFVPYYRKFMYDGLSSFTEDRAAKWLNEDSVWRFNPKHLSVRRETCTIDVLDKFNLLPFFLKIHVQGFELEVLQGAVETIDAHRPVLLLANLASADTWLRDIALGASV